MRVRNEEQRPWRVLMLALGCKTNHYESQALGEQFRQHGFELVKEGEPFDACLVNTCTVTAEAGRKSCQLLRRMRREQPEALIIAMGCHAQLEDLSELCDYSVGTSGRGSVLDFLQERLNARAKGKGLQPRPLPAKLPEPSRAACYEELGLAVDQAETRAEIKIEDGCNQFCSYCAICLARGRVRSRERAAILDEAKALIAAGYREIVLTGIHICSFEADKGRDTLALVELLEELEKLPDLLRIRLGSLEPSCLTPEVIQRLGRLQKLCPQFHLSLQSGSDLVLAKMRRSYDTACYRRVVAALREQFDDPAFTTDVMVAFPYEDETEFQNSLNFVEEIGFARIHVFRYSPRAKTPAARWPRADAATSKERAGRMIALGNRLAEAYARRQIGRRAQVILERPKKDDPTLWEGYTARYLPCLIRRPEGFSGEIVELTLTAERLGLSANT